MAVDKSASIGERAEAAGTDAANVWHMMQIGHAPSDIDRRTGMPRGHAVKTMVRLWREDRLRLPLLPWEGGAR